MKSLLLCVVAIAIALSSRAYAQEIEPVTLHADTLT